MLLIVAIAIASAACSSSRHVRRTDHLVFFFSPPLNNALNSSKPPPHSTTSYFPRSWRFRPRGTPPLPISETSGDEGLRKHELEAVSIVALNSSTRNGKRYSSTTAGDTASCLPCSASIREDMDEY
ncbi:hypothetical protein LshimejAT787_2600220 [Lyophyllum shimeji]|uniref:Secreted protein n=1 Tax=Lyophyllum shimeji TaxID=47721 RepID=A0A9P3Q255_LYOSH|nr:hypothetical protein LshimejAT787_2600220 [Lyophyllum shimeji]